MLRTELLFFSFNYIYIYTEWEMRETAGMGAVVRLNSTDETREVTTNCWDYRSLHEKSKSS